MSNKNLFFELESIDKKILLLKDHLNGFAEDFTNLLFEENKNKQIWTQYIIDNCIREKYSTIDFKFYSHYSTIDFKFHGHFLSADSIINLGKIKKEKIENFLCCFNGADCVGRQFTVSILKKRNMWDNDYCSKNFIFDIDRLDGNIARYCTEDEEPYYRNLILSDDDEYKNFYMSKYSFEYNKYNILHNLLFLHNKIQKSFIHLVTETIAVSYYPWVTEKFVYPIIAKSFWLAYAQPGYHAYLEKYYKFKKYSRIFDYSFDNEKNPVKRLVKLINEIEKYRKFSNSDLFDLYSVERDTLEYNYENYISGDYLKNVAPYIDSKDPKLIIENYNNNCYY